jgi:hypothetical protein
MRNIIVTVGLVATMAAPIAAQTKARTQDRIPPGQMPPEGACRIWYDGMPPGQQPPPMSCRDAERIATSSREARVIYGVDSRSGDSRREAGWARISDVRDVRYESRYPTRVTSAAYENGYRDGIEKGRADARGRDSFDPVRHTRYRSADHGYDRQHGSKDDYKLVYRDGFEAGYRAGYGERRLERRDR